MKGTVPALFVMLQCLASCASPENPAQTAAAPLTMEEQAFADDFQALRARHGDAAMRFALADVGAATVPRGFSQPVFECTFDDDGLIMGCDRVDEQ